MRSFFAPARCASKGTPVVTINRQHCHVCSGDLRTRADALTDVVRVRYVAHVQIA
jgi:hypothetical protein